MNLLEGENPLSEDNTTYRTPIITGKEGRTYQAESCFEDYGPMGAGFMGAIIVVEDIEKANEYAAEFVKNNRSTIARFPQVDFNGLPQGVVYDKGRLDGTWSSPYIQLWNEKYIEQFYNEEKGLIHLLEAPFLSGLNNYRTVECVVCYDPDNKEDLGIEDLLKEI